MTGTAPTTFDAPPRPAPWRAWILAARPATLGASVAPVVVGSALAAAEGAHRVEVTLLALLSAGLIQIGTNLTNDYFDFQKGADTSDRLGPPRATQRGWLTPRQIVRGSVLAFGAAMLAGALLISIGGWPIAAVGIASILAGLAYTAGPYPLAYVGLGEVFVVLFFGLIAVGGTTYLHGASFGAGALLGGLALGALASAILAVNNLRDRLQDARAAKRTLVVRFGERFGRVEYAALITTAYGLIATGLVLEALPKGAWITLLSVPWALALIAAVARSDGAALNPLLGRTARLELAVAALFAIGASW